MKCIRKLLSENVQKIKDEMHVCCLSTKSKEYAEIDRRDARMI